MSQQSSARVVAVSFLFLFLFITVSSDFYTNVSTQLGV